jgi:DNA polymerase III sliding clamp (beta) subunit (PCNA family)
MELFTMNATTFSTMLKGALVGTGTDNTLPILTAIHVETNGHEVRCVSTDRYRLVVATHDITDSEPAMNDGAFNLPKDGAKELVRLLVSKDKQATVMVELSDDSKYVSFSFDNFDGKWTREYRTLDGEFPRYRTLVPVIEDSNDRDPVVSRVRYNPKFLGDIAKIPTADKNTPVTLDFTATNKPMVATVDGPSGVAFTYMLMPIRIP